jgi:hypothetical protein
MFELSQAFLADRKRQWFRLTAAVILASILSLSAIAQEVGQVQYRSQEVSEVDGVPVLIKHLPDWESKKDVARLITDQAQLKTLLGERSLTDAIEFAPASEAVVADYDVGRLIIVEHASPQVSIEADQKIAAAITAENDGRTYSRRIGNYNVVVLDAPRRGPAEALIDQVKYEKKITWLGNNPFAISAERAFVITTSDIFMSTLMVIVGGVVFSIFGGLVVGLVFFSRRDRRRAAITNFTDGGGMTRLNLDGFTPDIAPDRLLGD